MHRALPPPPPPHTTATFHPPHYPNPPPSVTTALSDLKNLLHLSSTALHSLPPPIADASTAANTFVPCPFNPNHRLPPSILFSHYLNCPSPLSLPHNFHYPLTLSSSSSSTAAALPTIPPDSSELTISLDSYIAYNAPANSFFYHNCPGPVTPATPPPPSLNLPRVLYTECADFNEKSPAEAASLDFIRFLPSEIWAIRNEIESWGGGFPAAYSSRILRAVLRFRDCNLLHLYDWIIANSPRYGMIIDCAMRDHVAVLVKLSLKVIVREALELAGFMYSDGEIKGIERALCGNQSFECPVLVRVMAWLALQLSVLYGEVNGKYFAVDLLKECVRKSASDASLFPLEGKDDEPSEEGNDGGCVEEQVQNAGSIDETVGNSVIFVSQVADAVAALYERTFIEDKIKALRNDRPTFMYQRNVEHAHVSMIADEERQKRPEYRPVIEYDGFLRHRSNNQDANRVKTKEELLAEERDYKRRRMSYRGKKLKRNAVEVTRGIIEEYMEEFRLSEGISSLSNAVDENEALGSENMDGHARAADYFALTRNSEVPEDDRGQSVDNRVDVHSRHYARDFKDDNLQRRQDSSWDDRRQFHNRSNKGNWYDRDESATRDGRRIDSHSRVLKNGGEKSDFAEDDLRRSHQRRSESHDKKYYKSTRDEHEQETHKRRRDEHDRISRKRERAKDYLEYEDRDRTKRDRASGERYEDERGHADRKKSKSNRSSGSRHEFDDRYDPAVSHDM